MSTPKIQGFPQSSYVWSARAAFAVLGVDVEFEPFAPPAHKEAAHLARHPMGKVPTLTHGDLTLFECLAVMRYAQGLAGGDQLFPSDPVRGSQVLQWFSVVNCYLYQSVVPDWFFAAQRGGPAEGIAKARGVVETALTRLNESIGEGPWITGQGPTAADLVVGPLLFLLGRLEGGPELLAKLDKVQRLQGALADTPAFMGCAYKG